MKYSIIIPVAPDETYHESLIQDLSSYLSKIEIIVVSSAEVIHKRPGVIYYRSESGRAAQMNAGAKIAKGDFLWFLHADTRLLPNSLEELAKEVESNPDCLFYFDLAFLKDATKLMWLNQLGVYLRSRLFKAPFGDQGFCISKLNFDKIGGFLLNAPYGEDHLFTWQARAHSLQIKPLGVKIYTSARKYKKYGWLKTTITHQYLWIKQAWQANKNLSQLQ